MVPSNFVVLEKLPLTANGKLDVRALPDPEVIGEGTYRAPQTPTQRLIADLYGELTGASRVGLDDSFFALGGDSITAIRLVSRVRQAGYGLSVKDIFARPIVEMLAEGLTRLEGETLAIAAPEEGFIAATPIERQFLSLGGPLDRFHQAVGVEAPIGTTREGVEEALSRLMEHHDALRLRIVRGGASCDVTSDVASDVTPDVTSSCASLWLDPVGERVRLERLDVSGLSKAAGEKKIAALLRGLPGRLDPAKGRMVAGGWVERGAGERSLLLLVIHHLSIDGVSWRVLLEDLGHLTSGGALPGRTHSIRDWSDYLVQEARSQHRLAELATWQAVASDAVPLPCDSVISQARNVVGATHHYESVLSSGEMERLFASTSVYKVGIDDLLLTALGLALYGWRRDYYGSRGVETSGPILVDLEGHGREVGESGLDLSRTVGWFTSIYPVRLDFDMIDLDAAYEGKAAAGYALRVMKEELRRTTDRGLGYGLLRWLNEETGEELSRLPLAQIAFNYLGRFEGSGEDKKKHSDWRLLQDGLVGGEDDPARQRFHLLDVNAVLDGRGQLRIGWSYNPEAHQEGSIRDLAQRYQQALIALVRHCQDAPLEQRLTPSDFPLAKKAGLDQSLLDQLAGEPDFEDVLPLTSLQQGLAYESWSRGEDRKADPYHVQIAVELKGSLDVAQLKTAFEGIVTRHQILRLTLPLSTIERGLGLYRSLPIDWRVETAQGRQLEEILTEDHSGAFDLGRGPLIRARVIKHDAIRHTLILSNHHAVLDGWSTPILLSELSALYQGYSLGPVIEWRDHLAWVFSREREKSLAYWRDCFSGAEGSNALPLAAPKTPEVGMGEHIVALPTVLTGKIESFAREHGLTLSTVFEGAFMLLLARLGNRSEVTIGVTRNGRSADRLEIDRAIGLYIGTLPLRAEVCLGAPLVEWLKSLQQEQAGQEEHSHISLSDIQRCADMYGGRKDRGVNLFDALFVYENYPIDENVKEFSEEITIGSVLGLDGTHYPLALAVMPGKDTRLRFTFDRMSVDEAAVVSFSEQLSLLLEKFIHTQAPSRLGDLTVLLDADRHKVIELFNDTQQEIPNTTLPDLFAAQVERTPEAIALIFGDEEVSYQELDRRANQLARYLIEQNIGPEDIVAI
ncbi:MAG: condensation domain-containing protein, partial [Bacteroidota bacterium]